ncbi:transcription factor Ouib-like [Drosophila subobscura]|uniref:transcription factor Ouib-like n=1 Tax=Drosophila subobscura TaxID=7241 RepID=UPI00155A1E7F|nr:transcription factor Ouib-like [Drosophila subobscura]
MSLRCRTCGETVYGLNATNLFEGDNDIVRKVSFLTGIWMTDQLDMPRSICACCLMDLNTAILFRERCIRTHNVLTQGSCEMFPSDDVALKRHLDDPLGNEDGLPLEIKCEMEDQLSDAQPDIVEAPARSQDTETRSKHSSRQNSYENVPADTLHSPVAAPVPSVEVTESLITAENTEPSATKEAERKRRKRQNRVNQNYICDQCGKHFNDKGNLNLHLVRHTGIRKFQCPECSHKEYSQFLLKMHIRVKHRREAPYACKYCDQRFVCSNKRYRHQRIHEGLKPERTDKPYACNICPHRCNSMSNLRKHEVVHSGDRPFRCEICDVAFNRMSNLRTHFRSKTHKKKTEETTITEAEIVDPN